MPEPLRALQLTRLGFRHGFSPRQGGVSPAPFDSLNLGASADDSEHVAENQRRFASMVGYRETRLFVLRQVHGREVRRVTSGDDPEHVWDEEGDALVASAGFAIGVRSADCVPVLLVDPATRQVAAAHAGWRGVVAGVVPAALDVLARSAGAPHARLHAALFPHIRRCCFEVDESVAQQLVAASPGADDCVIAMPDKPHVALDVIVRAQLRALGVPDENIEDVPGCTVCDPERFFSYRRSGAGNHGLHLTAIVG
jgi:polyphenol oxidase